MSSGPTIIKTQRRINWSSVVIGGFLAGVCGGVLMGVAATLWTGFRGLGFSTPWQGFAATFYGPMAFTGGRGVTTIGVLWFLGVAGVIGVIFSLIAAKSRNMAGLFFWGFVYGTAVWAAMTWVFVPIFDPTLGARITMIPVMWFFLHWIYGVFTGLFIPPLRGAFRPRAQVQITPGHQAAA